MDLLFTIFFIGIGAIILVLIAQGIYHFFRNTSSPQIAREARVVSKRQHVSGGGGDSSTWTNYYVTFEFTDGSREEFKVRSRNYSVLVEGDRGTLYSQGSWFKEFDRQLGLIK